MREQNNEAKDAKSFRSIVHENDKNEGTHLVQDELELLHHDEQACLSLKQGWHWDDTKGGWHGRWNTPQDVHESAHRDVPA